MFAYIIQMPVFTGYADPTYTDFPVHGVDTMTTAGDIMSGGLSPGWWSMSRSIWRWHAVRHGSPVWVS